MTFIDTHAHLYDVAFIDNIDFFVKRAQTAQVTNVYLPNCNSETIDAMLLLAAKYPDFMKPMMGLHPCYVKEDFEKELELVEQWLGKYSFAAVGEIGLDYHWDTTFVKEQQVAFERQIDWALQADLAINIHTRASIDEGIATVEQKQNGKLKGIFHCFGGNETQAKRIVDAGFLLGIGGVLTFKNSDLANVLKSIPLSNIVLETDAPYLAPVPYRGKQNESSYIPLIAEKLCDVYQCTLEHIAHVTTQNALQVFAY